ncbi:MAG: deaminase [Candidatus Nitrosocosmicus sp.]|nr:deaminase [Candidatus Nitrosocosmicus sp.]
MNNLSQKIAISRYVQPYSRMNVDAERLMERDESEKDHNPFGQNVRETFPEADVFVDSSDENNLQASLARFIELIFGNSFHTPTNDEFAMFNAFAASRRSGSLARQVGAIITSQTGEIVSTGYNDIPSYGGGVYKNNSYDSRKYTSQFDTSDQKKYLVLGDLLFKLNELNLLKKSGEIGNGYEKYDSEELNILVNCLGKKLKNSPVMNIIEYVREVHAEMAAIISASRHNNYLDNTLLYTTTFPCHDCTKHIIAAGIKRVVYIEPYPKSLTTDLFNEYIAIDNTTCNSERVRFEPFVGIAPRVYMDFFKMDKRKNKTGKIEEWVSTKGLLRNPELVYYLSKELNECSRIEGFLKKRTQLYKSS